MNSSTESGGWDVRSRATLWILVVIGTLAKWYCASTTLGTVDVGSFFGFGKAISQQGLAALYERDPLFNHMPLVGMFSAWLYEITGASPRLFASGMRLPSIVADILTIAALLRLSDGSNVWVRRAVMLHAVSPVAFMISGFHGNVDPLMVSFVTLAVAFCSSGQMGLGALFYALACNVKAPALLLAPVLLSWCAAQGKGRRFFFYTAMLTLAGWGYPLATCPEAFLKNVLGYGSYWGIWGITYWLWCSGWEPFATLRFRDFSQEQWLVLTVLKLLIIAGVFWIAWRSRRDQKFSLARRITAVWVVFMVFAPGVAAQYLLWPLPLLAIALPRWSMVVTGAAAVHLFLFYTVLSFNAATARFADSALSIHDLFSRGLPWDFAIATAKTNWIWMASSNLPWAAFLILLATSYRELFRSDRPGGDR